MSDFKSEKDEGEEDEPSPSPSPSGRIFWGGLFIGKDESENGESDEDAERAL